MKAFATALVCGFVGLMFFSLFLSVGHGAHTQHSTSDCVFAIQHETVCPMSVMDQIGAWQSVFMNALVTFYALVLVAIAITLTPAAPHLLRQIFLHTIPVAQRLRYERFRIYTYVYRALQELFARGILHPKLH